MFEKKKINICLVYYVVYSSHTFISLIEWIIASSLTVCGLKSFTKRFVCIKTLDPSYKSKTKRLIGYGRTNIVWFCMTPNLYALSYEFMTKLSDLSLLIS